MSGLEKSAYVVMITVFLLAFILPIFGGCVPDYSEGVRVGTLVKVSHKGILFKSYEGQIMIGAIGIEDGGSAVPKTWEFSTTDARMGEKLESLLGKKVIVKYRQWLISPIRISTSYEVVDIRSYSKGP